MTNRQPVEVQSPVDVGGQTDANTNDILRSVLRELQLMNKYLAIALDVDLEEENLDA